MNRIRFEILSKEASVPTKVTMNSAGFDVASTIDHCLKHKEVKKIPLDLRFSFPVGVYGRIATRSGLGARGITVIGGVIDPDYRGNVHVILHNISVLPFYISKGDRIAQIIPEMFLEGELFEGSVKDIPSERGESGFGSSGITSLELLDSQKRL